MNKSFNNSFSSKIKEHTVGPKGFSVWHPRKNTKVSPMGHKSSDQLVKYRMVKQLGFVRYAIPTAELKLDKGKTDIKLGKVMKFKIQQTMNSRGLSGNNTTILESREQDSLGTESLLGTILEH